MSTSQFDINNDEKLFPDPQAFRPERWIDLDERKRLSKYLLPFGRGTRPCLGMDIAYAEIYLTFARLFSPNCGFRMELYDTNFERDVEIFHDYFTPYARSRNGVKVKII